MMIHSIFRIFARMTSYFQLVALASTVPQSVYSYDGKTSHCAAYQDYYFENNVNVYT